MTIDVRVCRGCGDTEDQARLERCSICLKDFCSDCAYRATGRRFCTQECARVWFHGDLEDDDAELVDDDD